jgi:AraC family transcriptional regulator
VNLSLFGCLKMALKKGENEPFEIYHNNYLEHPENKFIVDLCIPVL